MSSSTDRNVSVRNLLAIAAGTIHISVTMCVNIHVCIFALCWKTFYVCM